MFIAGAVPLYGISRLSLHMLVIGLEGHVPHIAKGALYYVVGIRVSESKPPCSKLCCHQPRFADMRHGSAPSCCFTS